MIHDYNQTKYGVDAIDQCVGNYTVRRISRRWPLTVFYNLIDIAAINAMTIWLCQNPEWNLKRTSTRRHFLVELSKALTNSHNQRRSEQLRLMPKVKLALQCLGYDLQPTTKKQHNITTNTTPVKKRCYLCPSKPGRKVRQTCDQCRKNVCLSHSSTITRVTCHSCHI